MEMEALYKDRLIRDWFATIKTKSTHTKTGYVSALRAFTNFTKMSPEELISEAEAEESAGIKARQRKIRMYLNEFFTHLSEEGKADKTILMYIGAVRSFYKVNDIALPTYVADFKAVPKQENRQIPKKEDIQAALKVCNPMEKALILLGVSSGLSRAEIEKLTVKQFKEGLDNEGIVTLHLTRTKTKNDFVTFISTEASKAIQDYLDYRNRTVQTEDPDTIKALEKQRVYTDNDYLFCLQNVSDKYLEKHDERIRQLTDNAIIKIYDSISQRAGKSTPKGTFNIIRSHAMRKYFNTTLKAAGCDSEHVEIWMSHSIGDTQKAYLDYRGEKELYKKYMPYLTIQAEEDFSETPLYKEMVENDVKLKSALAVATVENQRIKELEAKIEEAKQREKETYEVMQADFLEKEKHLNAMVEMTVNEKMKEMNELFQSILKKASPEILKQAEKEKNVWD